MSGLIYYYILLVVGTSLTIIFCKQDEAGNVFIVSETGFMLSLGPSQTKEELKETCGPKG
jgi:hypothetical protein